MDGTERRLAGCCPRSIGFLLEKRTIEVDRIDSVVINNNKSDFYDTKLETLVIRFLN